VKFKANLIFVRFILVSMKVRFVYFIALMFVSTHLKAQTGIGTSAPDASAKLDVFSTTKGFLPPRMTGAQRNAIVSPAAGLMVYQTDGTSGLYYYGGSSWIYIINSSTNVLPVANGGTGVTTSTGSGNVVLSTSPTIESPTITSGNTQFPSSIVINPTTHATSQRAGIWMGNWGLLQDFNGDGTRNFSMTQNYANTYPTRFFIDTEGKIGIGNSTPTEKLEVSGNVKATNFIGVASSSLSAPTNISYGEIDVPQNLGLGSGFTDLVNIPLPSAGKYKITYVVRASVTTSGTLSVLLLRNGSNTQVSGTEAMAIYNSANVQVTCTQVSVVTTNAAETYKLSVWTQAGAGNFNAINDGNGRSKVLWEKLN
jgi:hypothetical protein